MVDLLLLHIFDNPFLASLPLTEKIVLVILILGIWVLFIQQFKDKKGFAFWAIKNFFGIIFALFFMILLLSSHVQIGDLVNTAGDMIRDFSYSMKDMTLRPSHIPTILVAILFFVVLCILILFFITRAILGRGVKLSNTFWEHKDIAQFKILWCNFLFFIMLFLIFLTAFSCFGLVLFTLETYSKDYAAPQNLFFSLCLALILVVVIFCVFIFQSFSLTSKGIDKLAHVLDATEILESKNLEPKEQMLLNLIAEMALASSCPMPRVFILKNEQGVNAMCSGECFGEENEKIAIFITQGALDFLDRDELQGVIGHEFSHAFHRDVALNLRIFALVFALSCVMMVGKIMFKSIPKRPRASGSKNNKGSVLLLIALVFFAIGFIGVLFAQIIQAAISRQKEFLADASSVQYTRNPQGIKSALQKIAQISNTYRTSGVGGYTPKKLTYLTNPKASFCAHMFFLPCSAVIFATHPPLEQRIARLERMGGDILSLH